MVTDKRTTRQTRQDSQRITPIVWDNSGKLSHNYWQVGNRSTKSVLISESSPQQRGINRGTLNRGQTGRGGTSGGRGRGKRPFHS